LAALGLVVNEKAVEFLCASRGRQVDEMMIAAHVSRKMHTQVGARSKLVTGRIVWWCA
jgi:hypothetical protein